MNSSLGKGRSATDVGDAWTTSDASELYDIERWGKGYFSIGPEGQLLVHPKKEPQRSIDLKQLVDRLQLRGINLPTLIRFRDILRHRLRDIHDAFQAAISAARVSGPLHLRVPDQGEPAAAGRGRGAAVRPPVQLRPRGGLEARAAGGRRGQQQRDADHLQRVQGCRVHRDGDGGPEDRAAHHSGRREVHRARPDPRIRGKGRRAAANRLPREARGPRRRPVAVVGRLSLQVRPHRDRDAAGPRRAQEPRHGGLLQAAPLPPRQPDSQHPDREAGAQRGGACLRRARTATAPGWSTWTSAAGSASITTARRRTSSRARTTRCRSTPTTSSITSSRCATRPAWRIRRSSRRAAARSSRITACSCSTSSGCPASATSGCPTTRPTTWSSRWSI